MRREVSTKYTLVYRWIIPGLLTIVAIAVIWRVGSAGLRGDPDLLAALVAITTAVLLMVVARWFDRAKRVWLDAETLVISDYRRETSVDLVDIESVVATRFLKPDRVRIRFKRPTIFGDSILFFPPARWLSVPAAHPVADELAQLADEARQSQG